MAEIDNTTDLPTTPTPADDTPAPTGIPRSRTHIVQDDVPAGAVTRRSADRAAVALERARICARIADDNRAKDILLLDLRGSTPLIDFFVIATASSRRQGNAVAIEIDQEMKKLGEMKLGIEGSAEGRWTLIDYGDFAVHVFSDDARGFYALEDIWGDAIHVDWQDPDKVRSGGTVAE